MTRAGIVLGLALLVFSTPGWAHEQSRDNQRECQLPNGKFLAECLTEQPSERLHADTVESVWFGTAPICKGKASECGRLGLHFWINNNYGDGSPCVTGNKVLCVTAPLSDFSSTFWVGTAPYCAGAPSDCTDRGAEFIAYGTAGDGHACDKGKKVLCARR